MLLHRLVVIRFQVVVVDLAIVKVVDPGAVVMILPQVMVMDLSIMDVMPGVKPGTSKMMVVWEMTGIVSGMIRPVIIAAASGQDKGNIQDQNALKDFHDVLQVPV